MYRRSFLAAAAAAGTASLLGLSARRAEAFGAIPPDYVERFLPEDRRVDAVLELFLLGGVSQYESFYCVPEFGSSPSDPQQWNAFLEGGHVQAALDVCGLGGDELIEPFATDSEGRTVHLGPFAAPLRERPDLVGRLRLAATSHDAFPHEVAIPLAMTGRAPGHPLQAGVGAHLQRALTSLLGSRGAPYSYVLTPPSPIQIELTRSALATGAHPGTARPLGIRMDGSAAFSSLLERSTLGERATAHDQLVAHLQQQYRARLQVPDLGAVRSRRFSDFETTSSAVAQSGTLRGILSPDALSRVEGSSCGDEVAADTTAMSLRLASRLIRDRNAPAKYVCVIDGGFGPQVAAGGYDTHADTPMIQARNLTATLRALASVINAPGEASPEKLDLDRTLIIINTEFGRGPRPEPSLGRGHWPNGFVVGLLGGPIRAENSGIAGAIGPDAHAIGGAPVVASRIAALMALGVWPFEPEVFNVGDIPDGGTTEPALRWMLENYLGVS